MNLPVSVSTISVCLAILAGIYSGVGITDSGNEMPAAEPYCQWQVENYTIEKPLCGLSGNAERGKSIVADSGKGNCLACHQLPIDGIEAFGTIGPPLEGVASRLSEGFIRFRIVDTRSVIPMSIMPGFYRSPDLINRPAKKYIGRTFLTAQQVEDVIAYLMTLK